MRLGETNQTPVSKGEEPVGLESVLRRMIEKGMFTRKTRTGESKEHAKEQVKLKFSDIIELIKREDKEDIGIVFESQFSFGGTPLLPKAHT